MAVQVEMESGNSWTNPQNDGDNYTNLVMIFQHEAYGDGVFGRDFGIS